MVLDNEGLIGVIVGLAVAMARGQACCGALSSSCTPRGFLLNEIEAGGNHENGI
jgi:hypothetical protein